MRKKKPALKKKTVRRAKVARVKKAGVTKKTGAAKRLSQRKKMPRRKKHVRGKSTSASLAALDLQGLGSQSGGQSGDMQGLSRVAGVDSESVEELLEEGQAFEAEVISGVENAPDDDSEEVTTREVPEDDVPPEYLEED
jgi:hypothetical protein